MNAIRISDKNKDPHALVLFYFPFFWAIPSMTYALPLYTLYRSICDEQYRVYLSYKELTKFFMSTDYMDVEDLIKYDKFLDALGLIKVVNQDGVDGSVQRNIAISPCHLNMSQYKKKMSALGALGKDFFSGQNIDEKKLNALCETYAKHFNYDVKDDDKAFSSLLTLQQHIIARRMHPPGTYMTFNLLCDSLGIDRAGAEVYLQEKPERKKLFKYLHNRAKYWNEASSGMIDYEKVKAGKDKFLSDSNNYQDALDGSVNWTTPKLYGFYCQVFKKIVGMAPQSSDNFVKQDFYIERTIEFIACRKMIHIFINRGDIDNSSASYGSFINAKYLAPFIEFAVTYVYSKGKIPALPLISSDSVINAFQKYMEKSTL